MTDEVYLHLRSILCQFPHIYQFLDDEFIRDQCKRGLRNYLLSRLNNASYCHGTVRHLPTLERRLAELVSIIGYSRLIPRLRGASEWDKYQEILNQIDVTLLWFKHRCLLKEIEPELSHRKGNADILLYFNGQGIYCEVASFQSIFESLKPREKNNADKANDSKLKIKLVVRHLLDKTKRQLPPDCPGILALDATKSSMFAYDIRLVAERLFPKRLHVALIVLWSGEDGGAQNWKKEDPNSLLINCGSKFQNIGKALTAFLGLESEMIACGHLQEGEA